MSISQIKLDFVGEQSVNPRLGRIVTNDVLATVTSLNWLKQEEQNGYPIQPTDFLAIAYSGGSGWFIPNITLNGDITLVEIAAGSGLFLAIANNLSDLASAVTARTNLGLGNAAVKSVTDNAEAKVVSSDGGPTNVGFIAQFSDVNGSIGGGGINPTSYQAFDSISARQVVFAGGAATFTFVDPFFTTGSVVTASFASQANPASMVTVDPQAGQVVFNFSADPGASVISYVALATNQG